MLFLWLMLPLRCFSSTQVGDAVITVEGNTAEVSWVTDVATGTKILVKPAMSATEVLIGKTPSTNHTVRLSGIKAGVEYQIIIGTARVWLSTNNLSVNLASSSKTAITVPSFAPEAPVKHSEPPKHENAPLSVAKPAPPTRTTWANVASLPDHFARHGGDFHAKNEDDYARMAWEFLQRAKNEGLPCKEDEDGVLRIYDPKTGAFASYGRDGKTKTYFKPGNREYFERQPGTIINLKNSR